ncbi:MAG: hypothetical protein U0575_03475 [Phycisphaerales bacterium]|jgi:hypothetical protein
MKREARHRIWTAVCGLLVGTAGCGKSPGAPPAAPGAAAGTQGAAAIYASVHATLGKPLLDAVGEGTQSDPMLVQHAASIDELVEASRQATCDFGVDFSAGPATLLPHLADQRQLARVLKADAARLLAAGDRDGAAKRTAAIFRMASQIGGSAQTGIELLVAMAIAELGSRFVQDNPGLAQAAWKTDIQQAMVDVQHNVLDRGSDVVKREGEMDAAWLRSASDANIAAAKELVRPRNRAEREAAATKLAAFTTDAARLWNEPQAKSKLAALEARADAEGIADLCAKLDTLREAADRSQASIEKARIALAK